MKSVEINLITGKTIERQWTQAEIEKAAKLSDEQKENIAALAAKEAARQALLDKLGITADEAKLLLG
jgi:phosphopantetheinyl transferase (holo-ACP synthase)